MAWQWDKWPGKRGAPRAFDPFDPAANSPGAGNIWAMGGQTIRYGPGGPIEIPDARRPRAPQESGLQAGATPPYDIPGVPDGWMPNRQPFNPGEGGTPFGYCKGAGHPGGSQAQPAPGDVQIIGPNYGVDQSPWANQRPRPIHPGPDGNLPPSIAGEEVFYEELPADGWSAHLSQYQQWQGALQLGVTHSLLAAGNYLPKIIALPIPQRSSPTTALTFGSNETKKGTFAIQPGSILLWISTFTEPIENGPQINRAFRFSLQDAGKVTDIFAGKFAMSTLAGADSPCIGPPPPGSPLVEPTSPSFLMSPYCSVRPGRFNWAITNFSDAGIQMQLALGWAIQTTGPGIGNEIDSRAIRKGVSYATEGSE